MPNGKFPIAEWEYSHYASFMETALAADLFALASAYGEAKNIEEATVGRHCAADGRFFERLRDGKTFTIRKYDEVVAWFATNWPAQIEWPPEVARPAPAPVGATP